MDESVVVTRALPNSAEAERAVVAAMLAGVLENESMEAISIATEILSKEDFFHTAYGMVFDSMYELFEAGQPIDIVTIVDKLREKKAPADVADAAFLTDLVAQLPTTVNVKRHAEMVKEKSVLRQVIRVNQKIENDCFAGEEKAEVLMDRIEADFLALLQKRGVGDYTPISTIVMNALERINEASKNQGNVTGISTGFKDLDDQTAGLQPSDLVLIAARPSMGKTAFALNIAQHVAFEEDMCVAIFSLEMSKEQLVNRLFALETKIDATKLRTGDLNSEQWDGLIDGATRIGKSKLIIDDTGSISVAELRSKCRKYKQENDLKLVIIDYLQLMSSSGRSESRQQEISDISRSLKTLARELNVPIVALSQLNRGVEQRDDKRPMLSDLRDSGAIEQDADVVMFLYRDDYYHKDTTEKNISEIIIAKQRNGPVGTITLVWLPQFTMFKNREHRKKSEGSGE